MRPEHEALILKDNLFIDINKIFPMPSWRYYVFHISEVSGMCYVENEKQQRKISL
jgi:hypothetical protein